MHRVMATTSATTSKCIKQLLTEQRTVIANARLKSNQRQRMWSKHKGAYLGSASQSMKVTKKPTETYFDINLSDADNELIGQNDFVGVKPIHEKAYRKLTPENAFGYIQEQLLTNRRISAEFFMINLLLQLENKNEDFKQAILRRPDYYVPIFVRCCSHLMSDLHKVKSKRLLDRLIAALESSGIPLSLASFNAILLTKLENDDEFDVNEMLEEVEQKRKLESNITFFNALFWQLAKKGDLKEFGRLLDLCVQRGIQLNKETDLAEIYFFERCGISIKSDALVKRFASRHGDSKKYEALGAACCGAVKGKYVDRLRVLLRQSVCTDLETGRYVLKIPQTDIFNIIWMLAENSKDGIGKQLMLFAQQILDHAERNRGFFKQLFIETKRHINHDYFYSAIVLFEDMYRVRFNFESQNKTSFSSHIMSRLSNRMVIANLDTKIMLELSNRVMAFSEIDSRFYDNIVLAILTYRNSTPMEKFEQFKDFVNLIDPERERIHLILPLIATCPDLISRYKMLYRCSLLGYKNISDLNTFFMFLKIFLPFMEESKARHVDLSDTQHLDRLVQALKSYSVSLKEIWILYYNLLKEQRLKQIHVGISSQSMAEWLKSNKDKFFPKQDTKTSEVLASLNYALLKRLVMEERNSEKVHNFLKLRQFPPNTSFEEITEPLIYLYIETANWGYLQKLLQLLSQYNSKPENANFDKKRQNLENNCQFNFVKNYHLLHILRRKLDEIPTNTNLSSLVEYVYELKRMFPTAVAESETFFDTISAYRRLFSALTRPKNNWQISTPYVEQTIELLTALIRLDIINLHTNETLTPFLIMRVLTGIGWNVAVDTWMKFQVTFQCSNGVLELFRYSIKHNDKQKMAFVAHKARTFISPSKVEVFLAAAYVLQGQQDKAADVLKQADPTVDPWEVTHVFRLTNAILASVQQTSNFSLKFMTICLQHTNLGKHEKPLQLCHLDWIRTCERFDQGIYALKFVDLFKQHNLQLGEAELIAVRQLLKKHNKLVDKWIIDKSSLLNLDNVRDSEAVQNIDVMRQKLHEIQLALQKSSTLLEHQPIQKQTS